MVRLFSHTDLDGIGCGILAQLAFGKDNVEISYCDYDNIDSSVREYLETEQDNTIPIYITDIRVNEETAELLNKRGNVKLLDHHLTALGLNKYDWCDIVIEDSKGIKTSGTMLFYHWLGMNGCLSEELDNNKALERFAELVRDYDTWRWSTLGDDGIICKQVNDLLYLYGRDDFVRWCISEIHDEVFPRLYAKDEVVLKIKQDEIGKIC